MPRAQVMSINHVLNVIIIMNVKFLRFLSWVKLDEKGQKEKKRNMLVVSCLISLLKNNVKAIYINTYFLES